MTTEQRIRPGCRVVMHYQLSLKDGTELDATLPSEPIDFRLGDGTMIEGLELALLGMQAGQKDTLVIPPETGFGWRDPAAVQWMPKSDFPPQLDPQVGQIISFSLPGGDEIPGAILAVEDDRVQVDLNHPLAGREVVFTVEILEVE